MSTKGTDVVVVCHDDDNENVTRAASTAACEPNWEGL